MSMSSSKDHNNDDYVAKLLAEEAKRSSQRYASAGLQALLPKRATNGAPKPNTKFLTGLIRETDSHNAALKKKEELEAKIRLRKLREEEVEERFSGRDLERRPSKRRRKSNDFWERDRFDGPLKYDHGKRRSGDKSRRDSGSEGGRERNPHEPQRDRRSDRTSHQKNRRNSNSEDDRRRTTRRDHDRRHKARERSPLVTSDSSHEDRQKRKEHREDRPRMKSRERVRKSLPDEKKSTAKKSPATDSPQTPRSQSSDTDPLEAIVGPLPAPESKSKQIRDPLPATSKGRGAFRPSVSMIDSHFASTYDPSLDIRPKSEPEDGKEDWDMALEALQDRELWKKKGAERLKAAGFGDEEIKKWEDSGREKGIEDVKWAKKGTEREWDAGKIFAT